MNENKQALRQAFKRLEVELPRPVGGVLRWLRHPASRLVRIPVAFLLILGGVFSFLPAFGLWMLPLGLMLIASDVPFLQKPISRFAVWGAESWARLRRWTSRKLGGAG
jgi:hypothetical protein